MVKISELIPAAIRDTLYSTVSDGERVRVTRHAVRRFLDWRRHGSVGFPEARDAEAFLTRIAREGERTRRLPGGAFEVEWRGLHAAVKPEGNELVVLTFNGDGKWNRWWRRQRRREKLSAKVLAALGG